MYGQYMCCGQVPLYGHHRYHRHGDKNDLPGFGHYCPSCHQSASGIGGGWEFYTRLWNDKLHTDPLNPPPVNAPEDYRYAAFEATMLFLGTTVRTSSHGILFKTTGDLRSLLVANSKVIVERDANLPDLEILSLDGKHHHVFDMTKKRGIHATISARRALFGHTTITLDITTMQSRTGWDLRDFCAELELEEY